MGSGLGRLSSREVRTSAPMIWYLALNLMFRYLPKPAGAKGEVAKGEATAGCHTAEEVR